MIVVELLMRGWKIVQFNNESYSRKRSLKTRQMYKRKRQFFIFNKPE